MQPVPAWPPVPGHYLMRLIRGGTMVPVRIWHGPALIDGEEQDRSHDWRCEIDGKTDYVETGPDGYRCTVALPADKAWPWCAKHPIEEWVYRHRLEHGRWAKQHSPDHPEASPRERPDVRGKSVF